jgi:hypothetical protein
MARRTHKNTAKARKRHRRALQAGVRPGKILQIYKTSTALLAIKRSFL